MALDINLRRWITGDVRTLCLSASNCWIWQLDVSEDDQRAALERSNPRRFRIMPHWCDCNGISIIVAFPLNATVLWKRCDLRATSVGWSIISPTGNLYSRTCSCQRISFCILEVTKESLGFITNLSKCRLPMLFFFLQMLVYALFKRRFLLLEFINNLLVINQSNLNVS